MLRDQGIEISMDGRGRCHDDIFVERLWWTVKHEWVYLRPAAKVISDSGPPLTFPFLKYRTPLTRISSAVIPF